MITRLKWLTRIRTPDVPPTELSFCYLGSIAAVQTHRSQGVIYYDRTLLSALKLILEHGKGGNPRVDRIS